MPVSEHDRAYFQRLGRYKAESHAEAAQEHAKLSIDERLARSWALYVAHRNDAEPGLRDDDPTPFYDRARALGLYRP